ncbi:hypothetical protein ANCCEY_08070 [Ancylostoma ceylanicum]|uniref:Uncharacterized protein n=1 Tax=Ancylostoma ceylanicum TaxID=53326 RepID=A0A0D6LLQ3_9BILA|nr:hypothetical protein ANCCEY_08070 [Ancylostoma ceylanicum]
MSDFGRENRRDDKSILLEVAWRELGRKLVVACGSRCSTLAYQLEGLMGQSSVGGSRTLGFLRTVTEMLNEPFALFIDVVDNGLPNNVSPYPRVSYDKNKIDELQYNTRNEETEELIAALTFRTKISFYVTELEVHHNFRFFFVEKDLVDFHHFQTKCTPSTLTSPDASSDKPSGQPKLGNSVWSSTVVCTTARRRLLSRSRGMRATTVARTLRTTVVSSSGDTTLSVAKPFRRGWSQEDGMEYNCCSEFS